MQALDFSENGRPVSRLAAAKDVVRKFVEGRPDDRIGLVAFAKRPYLMCPLTLDHDWLLKRLDALEDGMGEDGTAIGAALASAGNQLKDLDVKSRVVVLLTDGMNNAGKISPAAAAEAASALGIKAYTVGAGTRGEAPMPVKDAFGNVEIRMAKTDIDEKTLGEIATATGGRYFRATDTESLEKTYAEIDSLEKTTRVLEKFSNYAELFAYGVLAALMFLGAELVLGHTLVPPIALRRDDAVRQPHLPDHRRGRVGRPRPRRDAPASPAPREPRARGEQAPAAGLVRRRLPRAAQHPLRRASARDRGALRRPRAAAGGLAPRGGPEARHRHHARDSTPRGACSPRTSRPIVSREPSWRSSTSSRSSTETASA